MCNQAVSLIAAECEQRGISTVVLQLLRSVAEKVRPPRALVVPYKHGFPLGKPNDREVQTQVIEAAFRVLEAKDAEPPVLVDYQ